ncbi:lipid II flippase MurJ [Altererythrobacter sp. H2]|uniref:lipid II flippase MurJ n=1 Tax=Altererythrobacter sp. H2 TaxID=3108391 RepID=UPI002B4BFA3A|nr:lipid II flippase MurJ [Altererythrobacter sp. H2]WRK95995.1 lipid II flippase MurJ [Altererythrobacter sp. H2]
MISIWILLLTIAAKLTAVIKDVIFAGAFGAGVDSDAYFIANQLPGIVWLSIYGTIVAVFLPQYVQAMANPAAAARLANQTVRFYAYAAVVLAAMCWLAAEWLVLLIAPAADQPTRDLATQLTRIMVLGFVLTGYVGVQSAIQQAHRSFLPPLAVPVINNAIATGAVVLAWLWSDVTIAVIGAVSAYLVQAVIQRTQTRRFYRTEWSWRVSADVWKRLSLLSGPVLLAVVLDQVNLLVANALASGFGTGAISQLNYASRLTLLVAGVFSFLVSYLFFPALASHASKGEDAANARLLARALGMILTVTAPVAAAAMAMRSDIISLIYARGAFSTDNVTVTAGLFGLLGLGIIFISMRELLNRLFFSYQKTSYPLIIGLSAVSVNIGSSIFLSRQFGIFGIAAGSSISAAFFFAGQIILILLWKPHLLSRDIATYFISACGAAAGAFMVGSALAEALAYLALPIRLIAGSMAIMAIYALLLILLLLICGMSPPRFVQKMRGTAPNASNM